MGKSNGGTRASSASSPRGLASAISASAVSANGGINLAPIGEVSDNVRREYERAAEKTREIVGNLYSHIASNPVSVSDFEDTSNGGARAIIRDENGNRIGAMYVEQSRTDNGIRGARLQTMYRVNIQVSEARGGIFAASTVATGLGSGNGLGYFATKDDAKAYLVRQMNGRNLTWMQKVHR